MCMRASLCICVLSGRAGVRVCVCVFVRARACVHACVRACVLACVFYQTVNVVNQKIKMCSVCLTLLQPHYFHTEIGKQRLIALFLFLCGWQAERDLPTNLLNHCMLSARCSQHNAHVCQTERLC